MAALNGMRASTVTAAKTSMSTALIGSCVMTSAKAMPTATSSSAFLGVFAHDCSL